jgi:hypothetical protein
VKEEAISGGRGGRERDERTRGARREKSAQCLVFRERVYGVPFMRTVSATSSALWPVTI